MFFIEKIRELLCMNDEEAEVGHVLAAEILRDYDIRGIFGENLFASDAYDIGLAFGTVIGRKNLKKVCVGYDCRKSSDTLARNLIKGLTNTGAEVISLGLCHTPMMYYGVYKLNLDAGIMITGSHNPPEYNGFKIMLGKDPFCGADIKTLGEMITNKDFIEKSGREVVLNRTFSNYVSDIIEDFHFSSDVKVAWDIGNGTTSNAVKAITAMIPGKHHLLFEEMDGNFPNRLPDPTVAKNIEYLSKFVSYNNFDIGFAFDSDGDRLAVVDSSGHMLFSDQILEVLAVDFLKKNPGAQVIADIKSCNRLFNTIRKSGGIEIMERAGHSFIKMRMKTSRALLAGEMSGHFFFKDRWLGFDDGIYAALRCLEIVGKNKGAFNNLEHGFITPEIRITCDESRKFKIIEDVKRKLKREGANLIEIDGARVTSDQGWWILRASNTQNALSLRIEANSADDMIKLKEKIHHYLVNEIKNIGEILKNENA
ncbi:MAG: phosphomannomutase/phosphoglucomutase [Holosporaceae bacterium]|jgi:phosphomannomutase|nr:phosphomannomutase/phosphoglucomutase [Holosporaceae bacterium]